MTSFTSYNTTDQQTEPPTASHSRQSPASTPADISEGDEDSGSDLASSESEEDDPTKLTEKYVLIQRLLWDAHKQERTDSAKVASRKRKRVLRLNQKLQRVRRDPLFDEYEAQVQWDAEFIELQAVHQQHMRAAATQRQKTKRASAGEDSDGNTNFKNLLSNGHGTNDGGVEFLGGIFGELEDASVPEQSQEVPKDSVRLLDLVKWSGLSPRKLLDEVCKSHDPKCRIQVRILQKSSYSVRHSLHLSWTVDTMPEDHAAATLPPEVIIQINGRLWELEMKSVAASNTVHSEAYICTLALFMASTLGTSEQRVLSRLPTVWRDLIKDLTSARQRFVNEEHKATLRRLRAIIGELQERMKHRQTQPTRNKNSKTSTKITDRSRSRQSRALQLTPEQVSKEWSQRISRRAFQQMLQVRQQLPVHQYRDMILSCIAEHPVSVICAETGAGKSSGIPVLLLEQEFSESRDCRILVTQPRRISAITLARRVSQELGESRNDIGTIRSLVGYAIRMESKTSSTTRITYATTGVLLRMLEESSDLEDLDYLILDEVSLSERLSWRCWNSVSSVFCCYLG